MANTPPPTKPTLQQSTSTLPAELAQYEVTYIASTGAQASTVPNGIRKHYMVLADEGLASLTWSINAGSTWEKDRGVGPWQLVRSGTGAMFSGQAISPKDLQAGANQVVTDNRKQQEIEGQVEEAHLLLAKAGGLKKLVDLQRGDMSCELVDAAMMLSFELMMAIKGMLRVPRPNVFAPSLQPLICVPGFNSHPGGHACQAALIAALLQSLRNLNDSTARPLFALAERIGKNRELAGLHTGRETAAGYQLGLWLARQLFDPSTAPPTWAASLHTARQEW